MILHSTFGAISLIMIVLVALFINGFLRPILILKQVCLIGMVVLNVVRFYHDQSSWIFIYRGLIDSCLLIIHQSFSCVFVHQIYKGVCEMKLQKNTILVVLKRSFIACLVTVIVASVEKALYSIGNSDFFLVFKGMAPLQSGLKLTITFLMFFYGIKILISLNFNRNFRESQRHSDRTEQRTFLAIAISGMMVFQFLKTALHIVKLLFTHTNYMKMLYCIMNSGSAENLVPNAKGMLFELSREENTGDAQIECYKDFAKSGYNIQVIRNIVICYHLEDISIVALIFYWKIKNKMSVPKQSN